MPTSLPVPTRAPEFRLRLLRWGALLVAMLALPIAAMGALESWVSARCTTTTLDEGVLMAKTLWRIERRMCKGVDAPFYEVQIGAEGKTMASAFTTRDEPRPVGVRLAGENRAEIALSAPLKLGVREVSSVDVRLRRSGSPAERVDLEKIKAEGRGEASR